ncbi:isovaleryl-CoA dehydrogenase [Ottowia caeni]|uniref:isovaleryl-CoA dehydrogenase n=1 Tax=Ottowia caeni TaxID=2870339 RepID=UPI001E3CA258|nr:isovaleryl-CoA dehydrogenase [Ottowia caeni]
MAATHEVFNQASALADVNLFNGNRALQDALRFNAPGLDSAPLAALGALAGSAEMQQHARLANVHTPQLHTHDRFGHRLDEVEFHPSYHALMSAATGAGLHGTPWAPQGQSAGASPHVLRAAGFMLFTELEPSTLCPISMTYAVTPALRDNPAIYRDWAPQLTSRAYDPGLKPWRDKAGVTMGMGMTEKQGGSDVRANTTRALHDGHDEWGERYRLTGHKWFMSAPMCDAFLVLAYVEGMGEGGLSCFFLPRVLPDGSRNPLRIQRLKDKLGNKANASSEVEFDGTLAWLVGEPGRGVPQILAMGTMTRLDCALGTSGLMRQALSIALHHTDQRQAFGKCLIEQPLMQNVLADLALESEAATALSLRLARAFDRHEDEAERLLARVLTPIAKFWICKRGSLFAQEAMECLGGNGYVEEDGEGIPARIYREMPVNSIWEGAGNIMALDLLRALRKGDVAEALSSELAPARGQHTALDRMIDAMPALIQSHATESTARQLARDVALTVQAALLAQTAPGAVFGAFCESRLASRHDVFGTLPGGADCEGIVRRAMLA